VVPPGFYWLVLLEPTGTRAQLVFRQ